MRKYKREIARSQMTAQGVKHINKKVIPVRNGAGKDTGARVSFFSIYWRDYIDPKSKIARKLERKQKRGLRRLFSGARA